MKGKNLMIYGFGAASGFVGGSVFVLGKVLESERMRQASVDILADKIGEALFGKNSRRPGYSSRVSYQRYHEERKRRTSCYLVDKCVFATQVDAEKVLNAMIRLATDYGMVRVIDYYDLCDIENHCSQIEDNNYGWLENDVANMHIICCRDGYVIDLPRAIKLK